MMKRREEEERIMIETRQWTLIEMHHPDFRRGYQQGRHCYFTSQNRLTDKDLVACLQWLSEDTNPQDQQDEEEWYYALGQLIGQISGPLIPPQPYEQNEEQRQQRFLAELRASYGESEQTERLIQTVIGLWRAQDTLAAQLDAEIYERVLHRNASPTLKSL
jgi:hypothetical protein